jgi:cell wall-associated NlpC family hydrolase
MSTDRGLRGAPDRALGIRIAAPLALLLTLLTPAILAPVASADTIAAKRQEANRVFHQIVQSQQQLESVVQQYDQATEQLHTTQAAIRFNKSRLYAAKRNLRSAQTDLEGALVAAYKQGEPDALQAVLASKSLSQMMDEIDLMKRATHFNASTVARVHRYKSEVVKRQNVLAHERTRRTRVVKVQRARKLQITYAIQQQESTLASVKADIRQLIIQRQQAERAAARARALAASRMLASEQAANQQSQTSGLTTGLGAQADAQAAADVGAPAASSSDATQAAPPASSAGAQAAQIALGEQGIPYVFGGSSPSGFDCSGLVMWAYGQLGISLPHFTGSLWNSGTHVSQDQLEPGDLVFFHGESHVGIYIGNGEFVHAPHTGDVVKVSSLSESWYSGGYDGAVRIG